jgi:hypothetical protein
MGKLGKRDEPKTPLAEEITLPEAAGSVAAETASHDRLQEPLANKPPATLDEIRTHVDVSAWGGRQQLKCKHCSWDTLRGPDVMRRHLHEAHLGANNELRIAVADKRGRAKS